MIIASIIISIVIKYAYIAFNNAIFMTRPAKTGHICTQTLRHFLNVNLILLHTYLSYLNETFRTYCEIHEESFKTCKTCLSYPETKKLTFF